MAPGTYARNIIIRLLAVLVALCLLPGRPHAALVYKNYIIQQDGGRDILCAPYTVKSGDWVSKILRLRGEIARQDFPLFLEIFQLINPQVKDINRIRPGQQIMIPLRIVESGSLQGQQQGLVTIPFVDLSTRMGVRPSGAQAIRYRVKTGDSLSKLVAAQFGRYGTQSYREGVRLLKELNPQVKDMDQIFVGQVIFLPMPGMADPGGPVPVPSPAMPDTTRYRHLSDRSRHAG
jgi:LysM repeat protein